MSTHFILKLDHVPVPIMKPSHIIIKIDYEPINWVLRFTFQNFNNSFKAKLIKTVLVHIQR